MPANDDTLTAEVQSIVAYLGLMSGELAGLARSARLDFLAYLLAMAGLEAQGLSEPRRYEGATPCPLPLPLPLLEAPPCGSHGP